MLVRTIIKAKFFALLSILVVITGCTTVDVYPQKNNPNAVYKLRNAHVAWVENPLFNISINKSAHGVKPIIYDSEKTEAKQSIGQLVLLFQKSGIEKIKESLLQKGVVDGDEVILELTPRLAVVSINVKRTFGVLVTIKQKGSTQVVWSTIMYTHGADSRKDEFLLDNFISALEKELKSAGWIV